MRTVNKIPTGAFIITRHTCHRCIYIFVIVITTVVAFFMQCTIKYFTITYLLSPFLVLFRWLQTFRNEVIFRSASKTFARRVFHTFVVQITIRTSFLLSLSDPFELFSVEWLSPPKECTFYGQYFSLTIFTKIWTSVNI